MEKNIRIIAINSTDAFGNSVPGFDIYLDFSGKREKIVHHKHNGLLYAVLKDGMRLDQFRRMRPDQLRTYCGGTNSKQSRSRLDKLSKMIKNLLSVVDTYLVKRTVECTQQLQAA